MSKKQLLKPTNMDPETEAALEVVEMERQIEKNATEDQKRREDLISQTYRMMGRIEAVDMVGKMLNVSGLVWLKQVKESKIYREITEFRTWESFCNYLGKSRQLIDEQLQNLDKLGEDFLLTIRGFSIGYKDLRKLRKSVSDGQILIEDKTIKIAGESIPLDQDHKDDLEAAIEGILDAKDKKIEDTEIELKAQKRISEEKARVINKQEKELARFTKELAERDFKPGEEKYIKDMENIKIMLVGLERKIDPEMIPDDMTPLMKAAYLATLEYFRRVAVSYYDTATDMLGVDGDNEWQQPMTDADREYFAKSDSKTA